VSDNINGHTEINFKLDIATQQAQTAVLDSPNDEVVNIGYGVAQRKNLTSNVATIDGQNVKYASYQSIYDLIKGEVAGVQVIGNKIIIRGVGTINGSTDPLFLIDGMETQSLDAISPRSVKSITVLKGADASIYGSRGANGVIMITLVR
jgi:TonB-dependent SusC/RagA subfamily outer membrane receptor